MLPKTWHPIMMPPGAAAPRPNCIFSARPSRSAACVPAHLIRYGVLPLVLMSARCVTDWTWPQVQVATWRRMLLRVRKAGEARWRSSEHMPKSLALTIR